MQEITGNWRKNFDYRYLAAEDLTGVHTLTIKAVGKDEAFNQKARKNEQVVVLSFVETEKMMVLNKTNAKTITKNLGTPLVEKWKGQKIRVQSQLISVGGESVTAVRVILDVKANQA